MKLRTTLMAAVASVMMGGTAYAVPVTGQISLAGYVSAIGSSGIGSASGLDFVQGASGTASPGTPGGLTSFGAGTGSFAGLSCASVGGSCGTIQDIQSFSANLPIANFLSFTTGGPAISFDLSSITGITRGADATGGSITLTANGIIHYTGLDNTAGVFSLTAQGNQVTSFSATTLVAAGAVPEPASLAILGGSLAALGLLRRKKA